MCVAMCSKFDPHGWVSWLPCLSSCWASIFAVRYSKILILGAMACHDAACFSTWSGTRWPGKAPKSTEEDELHISERSRSPISGGGAWWLSSYPPELAEATFTGDRAVVDQELQLTYILYTQHTFRPAHLPPFFDMMIIMNPTATKRHPCPCIVLGGSFRSSLFSLNLVIQEAENQQPTQGLRTIFYFLTRFRLAQRGLDESDGSAPIVLSRLFLALLALRWLLWICLQAQGLKWS